MLLAAMLLAIMPVAGRATAQDTVTGDPKSIGVWIAQAYPGATDKETVVLLMADLGDFAGRVTAIVLETDIGTAEFRELQAGAGPARFAVATVVMDSESWYFLDDVTVRSATGTAEGRRYDLARQVTFRRPFLPPVWLKRQGAGGMTLGEAARLLDDVPLALGGESADLPVLNMESVLLAAVEIYGADGGAVGIFTPADSQDLPRARPYIILFRDGGNSGFSVKRPSRQGVPWDTEVFSIKSRQIKQGLSGMFGIVAEIDTENGPMCIDEAVRKHPVLRRAFENNKGNPAWKEAG
jgi:hypothetical protein